MRNRKRQNWFIKGEQKSIKEKIVGRRMLPTNSDAVLSDDLALGDRVEQFCSILDKFKCHQHWKIKAVRKSYKCSATIGLRQNCEVRLHKLVGNL